MRSDYAHYRVLGNKHGEKKNKLTCKGHTHMLIEGTDLPNRSLLLQLSYRLFLYTQNNDVFTPDSDLYENIKKGDLQDQ